MRNVSDNRSTKLSFFGIKVAIFVVKAFYSREVSSKLYVSQRAHNEGWWSESSALPPPVNFSFMSISTGCYRHQTPVTFGPFLGWEIVQKSTRTRSLMFVILLLWHILAIQVDTLELTWWSGWHSYRQLAVIPQWKYMKIYTWNK